MSLPFEGSGNDTGIDYTGGADGSGGGNPAWKEFLEVIPEDLHDKVTPVLTKWDQGVQERFQKVQSQYDQWQPYIKAGVEPNDVQFGLNLLNTLNENPRALYDALREHYKYGTGDEPGANGVGTGQGQEGTSSEGLPPEYAARLSGIERQNQIMAQVLLSQKEAEENAQYDKQLDVQLKSLRDKHGDFDEQIVLGIAANGVPLDKAVERFQQFVQSEASKYRPKPLFMGAGGGIPGQNTDVRKMGDKETRNLAVSILKAAALEENQ